MSFHGSASDCSICRKEASFGISVDGSFIYHCCTSPKCYRAILADIVAIADIVALTKKERETIGIKIFNKELRLSKFIFGKKPFSLVKCYSLE